MTEPVTLILGGGGQFGAYEAGIWLAIEGNVQLECVVGASIGAVNGWAIASGVPAAEFVRYWLNPGPAVKLRWQWPKRLLGGLLDAAPFEEFLRQMCAKYTPKTRFGCALTELPRLRQKLVMYPEAGWQHLAASCAVFGLLPQLNLDGQWYTDGGTKKACPLWAAPLVGARRVLAVDCWNEGEWEQTGGTLLVRPRESLGSWTEMLTFDAEKAARWVETGRRDGKEALARLAVL